MKQSQSTTPQPDQTTKRPSAWATLARITTAALALLMLVTLLLLAAYLLISKPPATYHPKKLSPQQQQQALNELTKHMEVLYNNTNEMDPFVHVVDQQLLNRLLLLDEVQRFLKMLAPETQQFVQKPQIAIGQQTLRIMATARYQSVESVWTITLKGHIDAQGNLQLSLGSIKAGALALPDTVVRSQLERLLVALRTLPQRTNVKVQGLDDTQPYPQLYEMLAERLEQLLHTGQVTIEPVFPIDKNKNARVLALTIRQGHIELALQPMFAP